MTFLNYRPYYDFLLKEDDLFSLEGYVLVIVCCSTSTADLRRRVFLNQFRNLKIETPKKDCVIVEVLTSRLKVYFLNIHYLPFFLMSNKDLTHIMFEDSAINNLHLDKYDTVVSKCNQQEFINRDILRKKLNIGEV